MDRVNVGINRQAGRREWISLAVLTLPCLLYAMDLTVLNLAVPHLSQDLRPSSSELLWIVDIYGFVAAGSLVTMGTLGDRIGCRRLLLIGAAAFGATSLLAAWSTSAAMLIGARALLGLAGATVAPSTLSLIRNMFADPRHRTVAVSVWITSFSVGGAIGPLLGGILLEWFWWGSVFLLAVPVMALVLVLGPLVLPEFRDPQAGRLDLISAALSVAAVLAVIYGLKQLASDGFGWPPAASIVAGRGWGGVCAPAVPAGRPAAGSAAISLRRLHRGADHQPAQLLHRVRRPAVHRPVPAAGAGSVAAGGGAVDAALLGRDRPGFHADAGAGPPDPPGLRHGGRPGAGRGRLGLFTLLGPAGLALLVTGLVVFSLALAPVDTMATDLAVGAAPPERAGAASALSETAAEFGGALGIAILGIIGTGIYRSRLTSTLPSGILPATAAAARDTLGGAVAVAGDLPGHTGEVLIRVARQAFTQGLHVAFALSAVAVLGAAVLAAIQLRHVRPAVEPDASEPDGRKSHVA